MRIDPPIRRDRGENVVPMINVVFLLLVFFMMTATLAPPDPLEVLPPTAEGETPERGETLLLGPEGEIAWASHRGDAALAALARARPPGPAPLLLRADHRVEAAHLARLLSTLRDLGYADIALISVPAR